MAGLYVADTDVLVSYFHQIFEDSVTVSKYALKLIGKALQGRDGTRLSIPSIVFVEIFDKWCSTEEDARRIRYEILEPILENPQIEIRGIDREVLERFVLLDDRIVNLENHDKIVLSSAMVLECALITGDSRIKDYVEKDNVIDRIVT